LEFGQELAAMHKGVEVKLFTADTVRLFGDWMEMAEEDALSDPPLEEFGSLWCVPALLSIF